MRGVMFSNFAPKKFDSQKVGPGPTLSLLFIRFPRKDSPSGNQALFEHCSNFSAALQFSVKCTVINMAINFSTC